MGEDDVNRAITSEFIADPFFDGTTWKESLKTPLNLRSLMTLNITVSRLESKLNYQEEVLNRLINWTSPETFKKDDQNKFGSSEFLVGELDALALRSSLQANNKHNILVFGKFGTTPNRLNQAEEQDFVRAFNEILRMPDFHAQVDANMYKSNLSKEMQELLGRAQTQGEMLSEPEYLSLNRALLQAIYPYGTRLSRKFFDVIIDNIPGGDRYNGGMDSPKFDIGFTGEVDGVRVSQRGLMRADILNQIPKGAKIVSAVLYMKQNSSNPAVEIFDEKINLYELQRAWNAANLGHGGEVSWGYAITPEVPWSTPGIWPDENDVNLTPMASAGGIVESLNDQWLAFYFNPQGIESLERIVNGGPNYGWLFKLDREETSKARISFKSADYPEIENRPYMEIRYFKSEHIDWKSDPLNPEVDKQKHQ